jgi:hypothetical protein
MKTAFQPTDTQHLYVRKPMGLFCARVYADGKTKWISLGTRNKGIAKVELAKRLQDHYAVKHAEVLPS